MHWGTVLAQPLSSSSTLPAIDSYAGSFAPISGTAAEFLGWCPGCGYGEWSFVRTTDGGRKFIHAAIDGLTGAGLGQITFADATHGWIAANVAGGSLLATTDGGRTWHQGYPSSASWPATDVAFVTASLGFGLGVVGNGRTLLRTTDGGRTWQAIAQVPADSFSFDRDPVIDFSDPVHGWVATTQGLYASVDGGLKSGRSSARATLGVWPARCQPGWARDHDRRRIELDRVPVARVAGSVELRHAPSDLVRESDRWLGLHALREDLRDSRWRSQLDRAPPTLRSRSRSGHRVGVDRWAALMRPGLVVAVGQTARRTLPAGTSVVRHPANGDKRQLELDLAGLAVRLHT